MSNRGPLYSFPQAMVAMNWKSLLCSISLAAYAIAAIYETVDDLSSLEYDFVVVGGGGAGNVVANRLTEDPSTSVLILEAGGSNKDVINTTIPFYWPRLFPQTPWDWNDTTVPQVHAGNRSILYPRGHILGGTTSINAMVYTRGSVDDWDRYARLVGDQGWAWHNIQPYFRKNERFVKPADNHNITGQFDPSVHSFTGVNYVSLPGYRVPADSKVIQATQQLPGEFPYNIDYNSGIQYGVGWGQYTIGNGKRSSSATAYLGPQYINRPNLNVLLHARVARLIQTGSHNGKPEIRQVEFKNGVDGKLVKVTAKKEVILSAGTVGTPQILLNSGIGDKGELSGLGIKTILNLPSVGRNLSDHCLARNLWPVNSTATTEAFNRNATWQVEAFKEWSKYKTGILTAPLDDHLGWIRVPKNSTIFDKAPYLAAGPHTAHFEFFISNGRGQYPVPEGDTLNTFSVSVSLLIPASRGTITINSTDPFAAPLIDPNYLSAEPDISILREAIRSARRFMEAPVWKDYVTGPTLTPGDTDEELNEYIRSTISSSFHYVGTASMSPKGAKWGVVDPDLKVKGVVGLRVVDASVLPLVPAAHTQAPTYVVAERASDLIKRSWC